MPVGYQTEEQLRQPPVGCPMGDWKSLYFPVNIYIKGIDHIGLLNKVTEVISQQLNVNIHKLNIESNDGIFEGRIQLFVHDVDDVKSITTNLRKIDEIKTVTRIEKFEDQPN